MKEIRVAIAGVGNCASALVQGLAYYASPGRSVGLINSSVGGWRLNDIKIVAAFDIDARKVTKPLSEAIFAEPNCTLHFGEPKIFPEVLVEMGPLLDGVAVHMEGSEGKTFKIAQVPPVDVAESLVKSRAEILVCYLPVGAENAVRLYAEACIKAGVAFVNCVPVFIASDTNWARRFRAASLPLIGDDVKSQVGATILHRNLATLFGDRGAVLDHTYQLNIGGNTDFLNMLDRNRLQSKKISKTQSVQARLEKPLPEENIHIGPSDFVPWLNDRKICFIRMEGRAFGEVPIEIDVKLTVHDSPNSAGVVVDLIRYAKISRDHNLSGPIFPVCAFYMKHPPRDMRDDLALRALKRLEKKYGQ
jgi:myo-inositol-1-phosphate synthase